MAVAAVTASVNHAVACVLRQLKLACLVFIQRPQMVFSIKIGLTSRCFVCFKFCVADLQKSAIFLRCHTGIHLTASGHIPRKCKHLNFRFDYFINNIRYLIHICLRHRTHDNTFDSRPVETADLFQCQVEAAGLAEPVMGFTHTVQRHLVFLTAADFQHTTDLIIQMERIAHQGKRNVLAFQQNHEFPEIRMKDRIATGNIEIRNSVVYLAEVLAVRHDLLHLLPGHALQLLAAFPGKNIAVLAALVTFICDMPLKRKITSHPVPLLLSLLDLLTYRKRHMLCHRLRVSLRACLPLRKPFRRLLASLRACLLHHTLCHKLQVFLRAYQLRHMPFRRLHLSVPCPVCSIQKCLLMPFYLPPVICVFSGFRLVAFTE